MRLRLTAAALGLSAGLVSWSGCRKAEAPPQVPSAPSVRLYLMSTLAGALEPCGCRKDMLGGIDHAAALLAAKASEAPHQLLLAVGPLLFQEPELEPGRREQDVWKAEALAASLADVGLAAWSPGSNDFAAGAPVLRQLAAQTGAKLLAANLRSDDVPSVGTALFDVGQYRVGVVGIGESATPSGSTEAGSHEASSEAAARALEDGARALDAAGAQIRVALIAAPRGVGLRLAEKVAGFAVIALGKATESGDANDAPFPPTLVGETLVVQAPNHLQALSYVDLFVHGDDFSFQDGVGIASIEARDSLTARVRELEQRLVRWQNEQKPSPEQVSARQAELAQLKTRLAELNRQSATAPKTDGSRFLYQLVEVRESQGSEARVARRMSEYYRRVNEHNRHALQDRKPLPAAPGSSHYIGGATCATCHAEADAFWRTTSHAKAYETLSRDFKEFNLDCVGCHVTGYNRPGGSTVTHVDGLKDVQCETCHGPGSRHAESSGDTALISLMPSESVCRSCHNPPHVTDDWDLAAAWQKILGPGHAEAKAKPVASPRE